MKMPAVVGLVAGILVAPIALLLSVASGGAGDGDYLAARLWFPFAMSTAYFCNQ
jgi:hypothetical protein